MPYQSHNTTDRPLRVFLCHSSNDKPAVRELYQKLRAEPWIQPWLDEEDIYPGQDWNMEIEKAIKETDAIIVCLSTGSITKEGYVQKEIKNALDYSDEKPEGTVFIIPVRLEDCKPPSRLSKWQFADYFENQRERGFERLLVSLERRAKHLELSTAVFTHKFKEEKNKPALTEIKALIDMMMFEQDKTPKLELKVFQALEPAAVWNDENKITLSNGMEFMRVHAEKFIMGERDEIHEVEIPYDYWMARYPVTNEMYDAYAKVQGINHPVDGWEKKKNHPVVNVSYIDSMEYCQWLNDLLAAKLPLGLILRLPTEAEWEKAARGTKGSEFPWGNTYDKNNCNTWGGGKKDTTPVDLYSPQGDSPYGCADMSGNVLEWTHSLKRDYPYKFNDGRENENTPGIRVLRGGAYVYDPMSARCASRFFYYGYDFKFVGFRVCLSPLLPK